MADLLAVQSPLWWLQRLYKEMGKRQPYIDRMDRYYRGEPDTPWLPEQAREEFTRLLKLTRANYMGLVVEAMTERLNVEGFRVGDSTEADEATRKLWQRSNMDAGSKQAVLEAAITGQAYLLVDASARIFVEHPSQAIVEYVPGTSRRERAAGLKTWRDDWTGKVNATVFAHGLLFKYVSDKARVEGQPVESITWVKRLVKTETWPASNPLQVVPIVELPNNPRLLVGGSSEIEDVIAVQDRICKTLADRLMTQDFGAFPQKWATGFPEEDDDGVPNTIDVGRDRLVKSDIEETKFGQWDAAPLDPYSAAKREDVKDIASRTRTPAQYLLGEMSNVNGETLKASESGLVSKCKDRMIPYGEAYEETMRLARKAAGLPPVDDVGMETIWRNPEFRTEGELVDALVKMSTLGVPEEALWERWGATQTEIVRWKRMQEDQARRDMAGLGDKPPASGPGAEPSAA